jgi:hypothetical protein
MNKATIRSYEVRDTRRELRGPGGPSDYPVLLSFVASDRKAAMAFLESTPLYSTHETEATLYRLANETDGAEKAACGIMPLAPAARMLAEREWAEVDAKWAER